MVAGELIRPRRYEYVLTAKGAELHAAVHALMAWSDRWASPQGAPVRLIHASCGQEAIAEHRCAHCGDSRASESRPAGLSL